MGCASSKQAQRDLVPVAPLPRSYSLPIHHPPQKKGDSYHVVALTSTTLGSLMLDDQNSDKSYTLVNIKNDEAVDTTEKEAVGEAKVWSNKMQAKIKQMPKTPLRTPPNEPEMINAWELMEGLEEEDGVDGNANTSSPLHTRCFSFHGFPQTPSGGNAANWDDDDDVVGDNNDTVASNSTRTDASPRPVWLEFNAADPVVAEFDPEILSNFRKAMDELSPPNTCRLRSPEPDRTHTVQDRIRAFQEKIDRGRVRMAKEEEEEKVADGAEQSALSKYCCPPRGEGRVVIYFTSLRGVRKTYEDCCDVRMIFKGYRVRVEEKDVSMDHGFRDELRELLSVTINAASGGRGIGPLPCVFVAGKYVGGAEEVRMLHESGELEKTLRGCDRVEAGIGALAAVCVGCTDVRFVPCELCSGSCKVYDEEDEMFIRCPDCNENGLVCCPLCYFS